MDLSGNTFTSCQMLFDAINKALGPNLVSLSVKMDREAYFRDVNFSFTGWTIPPKLKSLDLSFSTNYYIRSMSVLAEIIATSTVKLENLSINIFNNAVTDVI